MRNWTVLCCALAAAIHATPSAACAQDAGVPPAPDPAGDSTSDAIDIAPDAPRGTETDAGAAGDEVAPTAPVELEPGTDESTGIRGRIVDSRTGEGLTDAPVLITGEGRTRTAMTIDGGGYLMLVPPGLYSVRSYYDLYDGARRDRVRVARGRFTDLTLTLDAIDPDTVAMEDVEVVYRADTTSAAAQDALREESGGIGEGMGRQQMASQGASNAGAAAQRVVGVNVEGSNLVVRGLGGRYTMVTLNGIPLPSTDPDVPSVDLDLFPSTVIESLTVAKAFLPNLQGNFAGGVMQINTVQFPRQFTLQLGLQSTANTLSTFQDRPTYQRSSTDWIGFDDGSRALPNGIGNERVRLTRTGSYRSFDQIEQAAERFSNVWQYHRELGLPGVGLTATLGDSIPLGNNQQFGFLATAYYNETSLRETGLSRPRPRIEPDGSLSAFNDYRTESGIDNVQLSALGTASLELGRDDVLTFLTFFNRSTTDTTQLQAGQSGELGLGEPVERWQLQYVGRTLWFNQLLADHRNIFGSRLRLRWSAFGSLGTRDEPDRRTVTYGPNGGVTRWLEKANSGERFYSSLEQRDFGGNTELRIPLWSEAFGTLGGFVRDSERTFLNRRFAMIQDPRNTDQSLYQQPVEDLFSADGIGTVTLVRELTRPEDSYSARQTLYAGFAMVETPIAGPLSLTTGARVEVMDQHVASRSPFPDENTDSSETMRTDRTDIDVLPAAALRLEVADHMYLRAAYGMTVARPQVRELAPYQYYDFIRDRNVQGNPDLQRTTIQNADLRWEWFFGEGEVLAASVFYKYFDSPIELQIMNPENYDSQFVNASAGHNFGGELEMRVELGRIDPILRFFDVSGNLAIVYSQVQLPPELSGAVQSNRALFGQAPYVANLSLQFDEPDSGFSASLVYNVVGPRITDVGTRVNDAILPNIEQQPFHSLNLVLGLRVEQHVQIRLRMQNLLFQQRQYLQGSFLTQSTDPGASVTLGITYTQ